MKGKIFIWLLLFFSPLLWSVDSAACDFHFEVNNPKAVYSTGDEVVITVSVMLTHRVCEIEMEETQFKVDGMDIIGATKWVQVSSKIYARKFKIRITGNHSPAVFTALRECEKDGGKGSLELKIT